MAFEAATTAPKTTAKNIDQPSIPTPKMKEIVEEARSYFKDIKVNLGFNPQVAHPIEKRTFLYLMSLHLSNAQRTHDPVGQRNRYNAGGGADNHKATNISIVHNLRDGVERIANTQHNTAFRLYYFQETMLEAGWTQEMINETEFDVEVVYVPDTKAEMEVFDTLNGTGIRVVGNDIKFISKWARDLPEELAMYAVLKVTDRKLPDFQTWHIEPFATLAQNKTSVALGKFKQAAKQNKTAWNNLIDACTNRPEDTVLHERLAMKLPVYKVCKELIDDIDLIKDAEQDNVQTIQGWTFMLDRHYLTELYDNKEVWNLFKTWIQNELQRNTDSYNYIYDGIKKGILPKSAKCQVKGTLADFNYTGLRAAQKDHQSIAFLTLWEFWKSKEYQAAFPSGVKGLGKDILDTLRLEIHHDFMKTDFSNTK